jgi:hypothetical protein
VATNQKRNQPDEILRARIEGRTYTPEQLSDRANQLEAKMIILKNRYEQFFLGIDRKPPGNDRDALHKELEMLRQISTKNTALKFKLNSLFNRFLSYERLWMRNETDIEEGRYRRDLVRARRHRNAGLPTPEDGDMSDLESDAGVPARPEASGIDDDRLRRIYDSYVRAKKECNESVDGLTFDHVANRIRDQVPELLKQANGRRIDFKVAIKDGKAVLRAVAGE